MKRLIALFVIAFLVITPSAQAAPKKIVVNPLKLLTTIGSPTEVSGVVVSGKNFIVFGTQNSKAYARAVDSNGNELWKLQLDQSQASIASAAVVDSVGDIWNFLNTSGLFSKTLQIGSASTSIESVTRNADKTFTLVGSSGETIAGKKLAGLIDGVIIKVTKSLKITSVVRSSISKGKRIWNSTTSSLLLGGEVVVGNKSEVAVTKFSSRYAPTWTHRFSGTGPAFTTGSTQLLFLSNGAIPELAWNPKVSTALLITFNSKGVISAADNAPVGQRLLVGSLESKDLGPVVVTSSADLVSIFVRNTR